MSFVNRMPGSAYRTRSAATLAEVRPKAITSIPTADLRLLSADLRPLLLEPIQGGEPFNPSVCMFRGELRAIIRVQFGARSLNLLGRINSDWELEGEHDVAILTRGRHNPHGYEDCRLFALNDRLMASATTSDKRGPIMRASMVVLSFDDAGDIVESFDQSGSSERNEKNWMPLVVRGNDGDELRFVHSLNPVALLTCDPLAHVVSGIPEVSAHEPLRGGSQLVQFEDGFLAVVHETHKQHGSEPVYLHRFVRFNRDVRIVALSEPFYFQRLGIEFCAGLAFWRGQWILSFGSRDKESWLALVENDVVRRMVAS